MILRKSDAGGSCVTLEPPCLIISPDRTGRNTREVKKFFSELLGSSQISKQWRGVGRGETVINALAQHERRSFQTCILEKGYPPCIFLPTQPLPLSGLWVLCLRPLCGESPCLLPGARGPAVFPSHVFLPAPGKRIDSSSAGETQGDWVTGSLTHSAVAAFSPVHLRGRHTSPMRGLTCMVQDTVQS